MAYGLRKLRRENTLTGFPDFYRFTQTLEEESRGYMFRTIPFCDGVLKVFCVVQLIDRDLLTESVIKPLVLHCKTETINARIASQSVIFADDFKIEKDTAQINNHILNGMVVILFSNDNEYIVLNLKKVQHRGIPTPQLEYTIRGPQDCFTENLDTNLSLIRYRLKDKNAKFDFLEVGKRTKTKVAVIYVDDIVNPDVVQKIKSKISKIDVDGIEESGELQAFLLNSKFELFPNMGLVERSDLSCQCILEGKVFVMVDGSPIGLIAPKVFVEFLESSDDRYDNKFFGVMARMLRYLAIMLSFMSTSVLVAITSFNTDVLPSSYAILLAQMRENVPFSALIEALLVEIILELLREALTRIPSQIGTAIGIVGAIVIGEAAISAGLFSQLMLIVGSVSLLSSFAIPDYTIINAFRILKFMLILATGFFGFLGFTVFVLIVLMQLVSMESFGVPYMAPTAPFNLYDFVRTIIYNTTMSPKRHKYLKTQDKTRANLK